MNHFIPIESISLKGDTFVYGMSFGLIFSMRFFFVITLFPSSFSVSFLPSHATFPPLCSTFLFSDKPAGFSVVDISVVTRSPSIVKMSSRSVI